MKDIALMMNSTITPKSKRKSRKPNLSVEITNMKDILEESPAGDSGDDDDIASLRNSENYLASVRGVHHNGRGVTDSPSKNNRTLTLVGTPHPLMKGKGKKQAKREIQVMLAYIIFLALFTFLTLESTNDQGK